MDIYYRLLQMGIYTLAEVRAAITGVPLEERWLSLPDGRYVDLNAALRRGDHVVYDEVGDIVNVITDDSTAPELRARYVTQEGVEVNDLVTIGADGTIRKARVGDERAIGIALDASTVGFNLGGRWGHASYAMMGSFYHASQAYQSLEQPLRGGVRAIQEEHQLREAAFTNTYQSQTAEKKAANEKAWKLLEKYMTPEQHFAFMEGTTVELINKAETHRILINMKGDFNILQGIKAGAGVSELEGRIHSYEYPLGDQISAFLDWFRHRTGELIVNWNCGTYGIVKEGERR